MHSPSASYLGVMLNEDPDGLYRYISNALDREGGDVTKTAQRLDCSRPYLWYLLRKLDMGNLPTQIREEQKARFRLFSKGKTSSLHDPAKKTA